MKKIAAIFLSLMMVMAAFAAPVTITFLHGGDTKLGDTTLFTMALERLKTDFPNVNVEMYKIDMSDGSALTMDAMIAAGSAPNVYMDSMVRTSKYMVPEYALPLNEYLRDYSKYQKNILASYTRNGKLLGLPTPAGSQGMCINLDIMKEIGFTVKSDWTVDDFLKMCALVKAKYGDKKWGTMLFAQNQSGDYLLHNWFEAFGAHYYANGNYDTSTIAKTGGAKVYSFYQTLIKNGYVPSNPGQLNDDDFAAQWMVGNLAAVAFFPNWTASYFQTAMDQGLIKNPFNYAFVPFPRAAGVKNVPTYSNGSVMVVHKTGDSNVDKVAARFVEYLNSAEAQGKQALVVGVIPNRIDATAQPTDAHVLEVMKIVKAGGIYDAGLTDPRFTERRALQYPILQKLFSFKLTPEAAIKEYEAALSSIKL